MASPIRNLCVARGILRSTAAAAVYSVPLSHAFIIKSVGAYNASATSGTIGVQIWDQQSLAGIFLLSASVASGQSAMWSGWTVLNANDSITLFPSQQPMHYWIAGALLPYAAPVSAATEATSPEEPRPTLPQEPPLPTTIPAPPTIYLPSPEYPAYVAATSGSQDLKPRSAGRAKRGS